MGCRGDRAATVTVADAKMGLGVMQLPLCQLSGVVRE